MAIFIDQAGRYYQQEDPKDPGDAEFTHPTQDMLNFITEVPISRSEFEKKILQKQTLFSY